MLDSLGEPAAARRVDAGIRAVASKLRSMRAAQMGFSTSEVGDMVAEAASNA